MNKNRLEALSDGIFSIVMTFLVFQISVPVAIGIPDDAHVLVELHNAGPLFESYFVSFAVLTMFWISHNFLYSSFVREINRTLVLLNMLYLSFIALIPFSARLLGEYATVKSAALFYGGNVLIVGLIATAVLYYAIHSDEIDLSHVAPRLLKQARIRAVLTPACSLIGIFCAFLNTELALFFFAFPILFNTLPGTLDAAERFLGLEF